MSRNFLIVGANFRNKGAQSMLFITVDELKKRVPGCNIYFAFNDVIDKSQLKFETLFYSKDSKIIALDYNPMRTIYVRIKRWCKDVIKYVIGQRNNLFCSNETAQYFKDMDLVIDISGFCIGRKWASEDQESYLNNIRLAKKYNIPIVLMPQSFGDFDYSKEQKYLLPQIEEWFKYPKMIFAREKDGYRDLTEKFHLSNVRLSTDLVLQNKGVDINNIYKKIPDIRLPEVEKNTVAIVPNMQCFDHGDKNKNLELYKVLVEYLISKGKKVYLFRHSKEDLEICKKIAQQFGVGEDHKEITGVRTIYSNGNVVVLDNDFSCFEYDEFVKNFDFIICSRFHGVVHAYRNYIPCILLGWAVKYKELAENVGQGKYAFDITADNFDTNDVIMALEDLINNREAESAIIKNHVSEIQKHNCFDIIEECLH